MDNPNPTNPTQTPPQNPTPQPPAHATVQDLAATLGVSAPAKTDPADEQRIRVNDGRLKKANEELAARDARIKELEDQLAKANQGKPAFDAAAVKKLAANPDEVGDEFADVTAKGLNALRETVRQETKAELDAMRAEMSAAKEASEKARAGATLERTLRAVEGEAPGLVSRIARGDLADKWEGFLDTADPFSGVPMRDILKGAVNGGRDEAVQEVYRRFVKEAGLSGQYGRVTLAPPRGASSFDARAVSANGKTVYDSREGLEREYVRLSQDRGVDPEERRKKMDEIKSAIAEHRYAR